MDHTRRPYDVFDPDCPSRQAFDQIFSRWGILTLSRLTTEPVRFGVLRREVGGISERMLAQTLRVLEEEGLVHRVEWDEKPPRVEYRLTEAGDRIATSLRGVIQELYGQLDRKPKPTRPAILEKTHASSNQRTVDRAGSSDSP
jgi:DNA-binding HxlR family transcriptional regulator